MQLLEFGQRFLNYKAFVMIVNNHTGKVEYRGMYLDAPYRFLRFTDVVSCEVDENALRIYISANNPMFFNTTSHFIDAE